MGNESAPRSSESVRSACHPHPAAGGCLHQSFFGALSATQITGSAVCQSQRYPIVRAAPRAAHPERARNFADGRTDWAAPQDWVAGGQCRGHWRIAASSLRLFGHPKPGLAWRVGSLPGRGPGKGGHSHGSPRTRPASVPGVDEYSTSPGYSGAHCSPAGGHGGGLECRADGGALAQYPMSLDPHGNGHRGFD